MSLLTALVEFGIPDSSDPEDLAAFGDALYARVEHAGLDDEEDIDAAARGQAPEFIALAEAAARANNPHASSLLAAVAAALPELRNLVFKDAADVALCSPHLLATHCRPLAGALAGRVAATRLTEGLQAYSYLEALTRLGLVDDVARFQALAVLSSVTLDDSAEFLERLPRLVGLAFDQWREGALEGLLDVLTEHPEARADALFELGQAQLRSALEESSLDAVLAGLAAARDRFEAVEGAEEARDDATIYKSALEVMAAFAAAPSSTAPDTSQAAQALSEALNRRVAFTSRAALGGWAQPRRQAEAEWYSLAVKLRAATGPLEQASWLTPVETLTQVLAAYQASRSVAVISADGLRLVLEPTVHAAFLRREGLLEHLRAALDAAEVPASDVDAAYALLSAVSSGEKPVGGDALGKVWAAAPALAAELVADGDARVAEQLARAAEESPEMVGALNAAADARRRARTRRADAVVDTLLGRVIDSLASVSGFSGTAREEFVELVAEVLRFAADRADVGRESGGSDVAYLFPPETGHAQFTEVFLQRDVYSWLCSSGFRPFARLEERDVAAGRADVTVQRLEHRLVIEVKRELTDASHQAIVSSYGPQTTGYSVTGPPFSIALVLDLTDHSAGVPSLSDSVWVDAVLVAGGTPRQVVTIVVRGNRPTPRQIRI